MKRFTDDQLLELLNDTESDRVERKESFKGDVPKNARQAVCAFSNDLPNSNEPGVLFIGAKDNEIGVVGEQYAGKPADNAGDDEAGGSDLSPDIV